MIPCQSHFTLKNTGQSLSQRQKHNFQLIFTQERNNTLFLVLALYGVGWPLVQQKSWEKRILIYRNRGDTMKLKAQYGQWYLVYPCWSNCRFGTSSNLDKSACTILDLGWKISHTPLGWNGVSLISVVRDMYCKENCRQSICFPSFAFALLQLWRRNQPRDLPT